MRLLPTYIYPEWTGYKGDALFNYEGRQHNYYLIHFIGLEEYDYTPDPKSYHLQHVRYLNPKFNPSKLVRTLYRIKGFFW